MGLRGPPCWLVKILTLQILIFISSLSTLQIFIFNPSLSTLQIFSFNLSSSFLHILIFIPSLTTLQILFVHLGFRTHVNTQQMVKTKTVESVVPSLDTTPLVEQSDDDIVALMCKKKVRENLQATKAGVREFLSEKKKYFFVFM